ncbi:MAG: hypothetical protein HQ596_05130 [Candidatus Saganbacteria bacterium]|nr:hypothetical protein [Candidatus Saganbacteria bacterium]
MKKIIGLLLVSVFTVSLLVSVASAAYDPGKDYGSYDSSQGEKSAKYPKGGFGPTTTINHMTEPLDIGVGGLGKEKEMKQAPVRNL